MLLLKTLCLAAVAVGPARAYWMDEVEHRGRSPYHQDPDNYQVFRNVQDFGARGDGVTDDAAAINRAISAGGRCAPGTCKGETTSPAVVYFPPGTYRISKPIIDYYYTQLVGDPTDRPVLKATADFDVRGSFGLIDGSQYGAGGVPGWPSVNIFFRQIRNLVLDTTDIPAGLEATGIHWPTAQATSLTNLEFRLSSAPGTRHTGLHVEEGSGGLLADLTFRGGEYGARLGSQQFTARNLRFEGARVAIEQPWTWSWTYKGLHVADCEIGIQMIGGNGGAMAVVVVDSEFVRVPTAIYTPRVGRDTKPVSAGSVWLSNVEFNDVDTFIQGPNGVVLEGYPNLVAKVLNYANGHVYDAVSGNLDYAQYPKTTTSRPPRLLAADGDRFYDRPRPMYENEPVSAFISAREQGAAGDGTTDDTAALNKLFALSASTGRVAFVDAGTYVVTDTVTIPPGARVVGEALAAVVMGAGARFEDVQRPRAVVRVGAATGDEGYVEWSDMIVSTRGAAAGAVAIEWNLATVEGSEPSGMWDVHVRIGGFAGTELQLLQCPTYKNATVVPRQCIAAYMSMHITRGAQGLFQENCWLWVADHDLEDPDYTQISVFAARGMLVEAEAGRIWLSASASEHHVLYQYQLLGTRDVYMGMIQTESPYFQPNPPATKPFAPVAAIQDPDFASDCASAPAPSGGPPCEMAWGLRVLSSRDVVVHGAGLYSFFNNYSNRCCQEDSGTECQDRILDIRGAEAVDMYGIITVGTVKMIQSGNLALAKDNNAGFSDVIIAYHSGDSAE